MSDTMKKQDFNQFITNNSFGKNNNGSPASSQTVELVPLSFPNKKKLKKKKLKKKKLKKKN